MNSPNIGIPPMLQVRNFQIRFNNGQIRYEPIENIHELDEIIRIYGRQIIAKVSFYFHDPAHQFHNIIIRNTEQNDKFTVEFWNYYNQYFEKVELTSDEKRRDLDMIMNYITQHSNLNNNFKPYIIDPFHHSNIIS